MKINRAYKVELDPTRRQISEFHKHIGAARFTWNWALSHRIRLYERAEKRMDTIKQNKIVNKLKKTKFHWMYEVSKCAPQEALKDLDNAFERFFRGQNRFPKFKKRGSSNSFRIHGVIRIHVDGIPMKNYRKPKPNGCQRWTRKKHRCIKNCFELFKAPRVRLPRLGTIRIKEVPDFRETTRILSATISTTANRWFISFTTEEEIHPKDWTFKKIVGVDVGIKDYAILSDGITFANLRPLDSRIKKYKRLSKALARKEEKSKNWYKALKILKSFHFKVCSIRNNNIHKATTYLAKHYSHIVIEGLSINGMMRNKILSRMIADASWGIFRRQMEYKCKWYGSVLIVAPRYFPSSKLCSNCGHKKKNLKLSEREYFCENCHIVLDRDLNAAFNLKKYGEMYIEDPSVADGWSETKNGCGDGVRPKSNTKDGGSRVETVTELHIAD